MVAHLRYDRRFITRFVMNVKIIRSAMLEIINNGNCTVKLDLPNRLRNEY